MSTQPDLWEQPPTEPADEPATETRDAAYAHVAITERVAAEANGTALGHRQQEVFDTIRRHPDVTNREIAEMLRWQVSSVTGRTKELREEGLVQKGRRRKCNVTGNVVQAWKAVEMRAEHSLNPMVRAYGFGPKGKRCESCAFLFGKRYAKVYYKCSFRGNTNGPASDHKPTWAACTKYKEALS